MENINSFSKKQTVKDTTILNHRPRKAGSKKRPLTTKNAVEYLVNGTLRTKVCRFCLNVTSHMSDIEQILSIGDDGFLYGVTIHDMIRSFYPLEVPEDTNFPSKICEDCLDKVISTYLFTQQCDRSSRALQNCFVDIYDKFEKLDPLDRPKKRGRQKYHINNNILYTEHKNVIDYAKPTMHLVNRDAGLIVENETATFYEHECPRCWEVLPNLQSFINHELKHPKSMWYNCRCCGKSFAKKSHLKSHMSTHSFGSDDVPTDPVDPGTKFVCKECGITNEKYVKHLQHAEKHKFKNVLNNLLMDKMDDLCTVCLEKNNKMLNLDEIITLYGGTYELSGEKAVHTILGTTLPDIQLLHSYTGTKICAKCLDLAITCYVFIHQSLNTRRRLYSCIDSMLNNLKDLQDPKNSVFIEISENLILPADDIEGMMNSTYFEEDTDEANLKVDVLEDEFRIQSEESSEEESDRISEDNFIDSVNEVLENPAKNAVKTYRNTRLYNGYQPNSDNDKFIADICKEFLTFKKKQTTVYQPKIKYTCPMCDKHFVSDYFLSKHVLKHINQQTSCKLCQLCFKSKFHLVEHYRMVHQLNSTKFTSCKVCGRTFTDETKRARHERSHFNKQCSICDKIFASQKHFNSHMQKHVVKFNLLGKRKQRHCSFCEKQCRSSAELSVHVNKLHLQIKPFSCDMCDKKFYSNQNLLRHKKIHTLLHIEKCEFCNKALKSRRSLVIHIRKHLNSKPYGCQLCDQTFYSESSRRTHLKNFHGGKYVCKICKNVFSEKCDFKYHTENVHISIF